MATAWTDIIEEAIELRRKIVDAQARSDWFFGIWQPDCIADNAIRHQRTGHRSGILEDKARRRVGHGLKVTNEYAMIDPIKLTFTCPGISADGVMGDFGIPAIIVTNYLLNKGVVCEKTRLLLMALLLNSLRYDQR